MFRRHVEEPVARTWNATMQPVLSTAYGVFDRLGSWQRVYGPPGVWAYFALLHGDSSPLWQAWATVARSCGPWWPGERVCVISERPRVLRTEPTAGLDALRPHCPDGPAVGYPDGWELYFWHGTRVPEWVITAPDAAAIDAELNIEVRRCAIERLGWPAYVEQAGLRLVATAADPGNPGFELLLYDLPGQHRVLVATNGSVERDGTRRRYGLGVPRYLADPVAAAAWTYGLSADLYRTLVHRT